LSPKVSSLGDRSPSRPGYIKGVDGLPTKRKRISHFNRPNCLPVRLSVVDKETAQQISPSRVTNGFDDIIEKFGLSSSTSKTSPLKFNSKLRSNLVKSNESNISTVIANDESSANWNECDKSDLNAQSVVVKNEYSNSETINRIDSTAQFSVTDCLPNDCSRHPHEISDFTE